MASWSLKQYSTSNIINLKQAHSLVGRCREAQVFLPSTGVSRSHANLFLMEGHLWIQALHSVNGTFVNGTKIPVYTMHKLSPGDLIGFGISKQKYAQSEIQKGCLFEVLQTVESAIASTSVPLEQKNQKSMTNSKDALSEIAISSVCSLANEKTQTKPEQSPNPVKMALAQNELVISAIELDKPVAETTDNPIVIDITDDAEDMDFSCSQILSQIVSDRVSDDVYQKIKNELAEMDYCNDGVVVNADLIDSDDENSGGFQNTQEIFELLEDTVEPNADNEVLGAIDDLSRLFEDEPVNRQSPRSNSPHMEFNSSLKEEGRKKLKELTGSTSSSTVQPEPRKTLYRKCKRLRVRTPPPTISLTLATNKLGNAGEKRKRGRPRKILEEPKTVPVSTTSLTSNTETSLDLDGPKRKRSRKSLDAPPEEPAAVEACSGNSASAGSSKGTLQMERPATDSHQVNDHNSVQNLWPIQNWQKEASKLLMWSNGGPIRNTPNNRRLPEVNDIIREMVHWIPNRLLEQVQNDVTTPIIKLPKKIPATFDSFHQYYDTFSKMVLMESWQCLYKAFRDSNGTPSKMKIQHARVVNDSLILDCISVISKEDVTRGNYYKPEDFVMLECVMKNKSHVLSLNFGFVQSCRISLVAKGARHSIDQLLNGPNPHTILEFTVMTRYQPELELNTKMTHLIKPLINIRTYLMLIRTMKETKQSPLCKMILKPQASDYKFPITHREVRFPSNNWNKEQKMIVLEAASLCTGNRPGIYCVKGPPGTGKSTVIVNLLQQILFADKHRTDGGNPMVLLTAPSNTAVDNLIFKIGAARNNLPTEMRPKIKLVRIGPESSIHRDVLNYSLPKLAEKHLPLKLQHHPEIKAARERKDNLLEVAQHLLGDQYQKELRQCEKLIIEKSNIICTTLNSCINARLIEAVNKGLIKFTCCVIDEATQCHEIESLLPVVLGIDKFVLVGDPQQLNATIMSREAVKLGFGESLFTRLANNFGVDPRSPIRMLTEQYRMHPEICDFPNKHFYEGKLRTSANPSNKLPSEIRPYLVFNCEKLSHSEDYTNMDEVILIKKLLKTIFDKLDRNNSYTVGIITPYNAQKDLLVSHIRRQDYCQVTINTVDSFQGSEKDIIIISCVRDSSNSFLQNPNRLNVALTRAKQALYIIGNYSLFKECPLLYDIREDAKRRKVLLDIKQNPRTIEHLRRYLIKTRNSRGEYT